MARYMTNTRAQFISLVRKAANRREFLMRKNEEGAEEPMVQVPIFKRDDLSEEGVRYVTGVVYEPGVVDTQGDQMTAAEIEKAAHRYMRDYRGIDIQHNYRPADGCWVAESTVHKAATEIAGQPVPEGAWTMTVGIENQDIIAKVDSGELNGFSIGGFTQYVTKADEGGPPGEQGILRQMFTWLGEKLGFLKPAGQTAQAPASTPPQTALPQRAQPPQTPTAPPGPPVGSPQGTDRPEPPKSADEDEEERRRRAKEAQYTMNKSEWGAVMNALGETLIQKGVIVDDAGTDKPAETPAQKSADSDLESRIAKGIAEGFAAVMKAQQQEKPAEKPAEPEKAQAKTEGDVQKSAEQPDVIGKDELIAIVKSAVAEQVDPIRETVNVIAKTHNMPTNGNGMPASVNKTGHYMDGFYAE